jgi:isopenicillin N synthase-like dioxygenase
MKTEPTPEGGPGPVYEQLREKLYADVLYPSELAELMEHAPTWKAFCSLPEAVKEQFAFADDQAEKDPGYKVRERAKGREDKQYYHVTAQHKDLIRKYNLEALVESNPSIKSFFEFADQVYVQASALVTQIAQELEPHIPGIMEQLGSKESRFTLRTLLYTPTNVSDMILADPHYDRSGFTLHLYESHPGLQLLDWDMQWKDAPMGPGHTIVFNGYQMERLTNGALQKTWHRVNRATPPGEQRTSMVFFVPFSDVKKLPMDYRAQDDVPGYRPQA